MLRGSMEALPPFPHALYCASFPPGCSQVISFYNKLEILQANVSLSSVSHSINQTHEGNGKEDVVYMCVCIYILCIIYIYTHNIYTRGYYSTIKKE